MVATYCTSPGRLDAGRESGWELETVKRMLRTVMLMVGTVTGARDTDAEGGNSESRNISWYLGTVERILRIATIMLRTGTMLVTLV